MAKKVYVALDMRGNPISGLADPTAGDDAATKGYVDGATLAGDVSGGLTTTSVDKVKGTTVTGTPGSAGKVLVSTGAASAAWGGVTASSLASHYEPLTNGDPVTPELIFDSLGDVIMVEVVT